MRQTATANHVRARAYAGTTGVLLAMDIDPEHREGLLGFAIERTPGHEAPSGFLPGMLGFPGMRHRPGQLIPTNVAPIQKFRWGDYAVHSGTEYTYTIHPVYGHPGDLEIRRGPTVRVRTAATTGQEQVVLFNRAAAASQAFSRKFPAVERELRAARREQREPRLPDEMWTWLGRGLPEAIVGFVERAVDAGWALDVAIYEYELPQIVQAVEAAHARGVPVRVVYHAKPGDPQTEENERQLAGLPAASKRPRITPKIAHHKYVVLSRLVNGERRPQAVLCGSTNFTVNGVYRQANVIHILERPDIAAQYLALFEVLFRGDDPSATRKFIQSTNPIDRRRSVFAGFAPRPGADDLASFVEIVRSAKRDVMFCTAFELYPELEDALLGQRGDRLLRYGLQNSRSRITGFHGDRMGDFITKAMLNGNLDGWLRETTAGQRGNILIHTKLVLIDFTSKLPTVISGSHNLSKAASRFNDENFLILRGDSDLADCYGCELMRLYDHYRFRFRLREPPGRYPWSPIVLRPDDSWTNAYFNPNQLKALDRRRFVGLDI